MSRKSLNDEIGLYAQSEGTILNPFERPRHSGPPQAENPEDKVQLRAFSQEGPQDTGENHSDLIRLMMAC